MTNDELDRFFKMQESLGNDFQQVLDDNLWNLYENSLSETSFTTTCAPPPAFSLEKLTEAIKLIEALPRFMTEKEFYDIHGELSGVLLNAEDFDEMLLNKNGFPVTVPRYFQKSPFIERGECFIISEKNAGEKGFVVRGK